MVDTLTQLSVLDDDRITADEKHRYKGISRLKGNPLLSREFFTVIRMPHEKAIFCQNQASSLFKESEEANTALP